MVIPTQPELLWQVFSHILFNVHILFNNIIPSVIYSQVIFHTAQCEGANMSVSCFHLSYVVDGITVCRTSQCCVWLHNTVYDTTILCMYDITGWCICHRWLCMYDITGSCVCHHWFVCRCWRVQQCGVEHVSDALPQQGGWLQVLLSWWLPTQPAGRPHMWRYVLTWHYNTLLLPCTRNYGKPFLALSKTLMHVVLQYFMALVFL